MKKELCIVFFFVILSIPVSAEDKFSLVWEDFFPACAITSEAYNPIRCGCEFLIPNLHIGMIGSMLGQLIIGIFSLLSFFIDSINLVIFQGGWLKLEQTVATILNNFIDWLWGIVTPFLVIILILSIEFIKNYLLIAISMLLYLTLLKEFHIYSGSPSAEWGLYTAIIVIILMFFGSIWLIGSDLGLYKPLIII